MDVYNYQQQTKTKRNSMSAYVPVHRRNEEDDKRNSMNNNKYRNQDLQVESSISSGSTKRSSFMGYRRPASQQNNRQSRNSFIGEDDVDYVSKFIVHEGLY